MRRRKRADRRQEMLMRTIRVESVLPRVSVRAVTRRGSEPEIEATSWLELRGTADEPIRDVRRVEISVHSDDRMNPGSARPASVGAIVQVRPNISVVAGCPSADFSRLWTFALSGHLKYAGIVCTKPRYNTGLVVNVSFSTVPDE